MARKCGTRTVKDKMSAVVKKALRHSSPASPRLLFSDVLTPLLPPGVLIDAAAKPCGHRCQNMEAGRWPRRRCDSHSRVAVVSAGLRWARTGAIHY
jgi:hypothetical protein